LATSGEDGTARLWDLQGNEVAKMAGHQGSVGQVLFSPDGQRLATRGEDDTARLWDLSGQQIAEFEGSGLVFSADWSRIITIQQPNRVRDNAIVTIWRVDDLSGLLMRGCKRLRSYLTYSPRVSDEDRAMCGIAPREQAIDYETSLPGSDIYEAMP
ncbi:MAG: hypothetical protein F6K19_20870, partial [Cyanothece sp. SIO1E1]|nr:hypothetical protein [Cyanothece sp. SIO1E1]